nr:NAD(+) diphosphatase [Lachnospiraceae bacterium]
MIQEIDPYKYDVEYKHLQPGKNDYVLPFCENGLIVRAGEELSFFTCADTGKETDYMTYLFSIDEMRFFYLAVHEETQFCEQNKMTISGYRLIKRQELRRLSPKHLAFAAVTAFQLDGWYRNNRFCGRCGKVLRQDEKERMLFCGECGNRVYPRINPAVIVAVTNGNRLLLTKYRGREYTNYALVAGFSEIGESFEDTVRREVMEEAGLSVKNIRYYGSQPWAFADNLLAGYFCEVDGSDEIRMDEEELSEACWLDREDIPVEYTDSSLTNEMICVFKNRQNEQS